MASASREDAKFEASLNAIRRRTDYLDVITGKSADISTAASGQARAGLSSATSSPRKSISPNRGRMKSRFLKNSYVNAVNDRRAELVEEHLGPSFAAWKLTLQQNWQCLQPRTKRKFQCAQLNLRNRRVNMDLDAFRREHQRRATGA
ncbi:unnamed protein product [Amoebophrya sp. A25]|nr:unnamed protein product [Amoebophrya sp. A25]|eukprot:GSA25T00008867001.1